MGEDVKKTIDFQIGKDRLDGNYTPKVIRDSMDKWIDDYGKVKDMMVIYTYPDEDDPELTRVEVYRTNTTLQESLGLLEWAKALLIEEVRISNE